MERYFESDFTELRDRLLRMAYLALENYDRAVTGFFTRDEALLALAVERDGEIDQMELTVDAECVELLLRLQPFAKDLRFAAMSLKINTNLERLGDQAVFMARVGLDMLRKPAIRDWFQLPDLTTRARGAVERAMKAFAAEDTALAREVKSGEVEINAIYRAMVRTLLHYAQSSPEQIPQAMDLLSVAQALERVADYAKNIADEVIYLVEAVDVRHAK